ncbi:peptidase S45 penicillin amidase [Leadbetterella byssophila DSM 17132]|uniref:Peptidase S45 penicillin amidase n=1 Tax=Leadbetterella byssophila (strain DSM 17132 / JCM 16389 / KACC 11308 / NBRC 106382 / 4M15) TaxID=649349 RepID=E4RUI9_LEAB4|nr:penicillin acylase family protein [Leadbetterella byssophila]ADQ18725.1 peptidase S45 penicillin amidase [Leadbetterella byssophila DSM 17132]
MKLLKYIWSPLLAIGLIYLFDHPLGSAPALGKFFSPFHGFLQNTTQEEDLSEEIFLEGVKEPVKVVYDQNYVPHVFAENEDDLYYTQGYLVARDRLWQMEFYTLVAAGRLTEVVGETAFEYDRYNRRLGMARAAQQIVEEQKKIPEAWNALTSYAAGVNAYISQLSYKKLPVEYKILGYQPEEWTPYKTVLMLMNMRQTLNGQSDDFRLTNVLAQYGIDTIKDLFPDYASNESPIIPAGTPWKFTPIEVKSPEETLPPLDKELLSEYIEKPNPGIGSNNWAIGGSKSATGLPILANDPHLGLSLPSIWFQMQLSAPGVNVYGVALPGCPGITIGFNKDIAWGVTNVGSDVMDFYKIKFKDDTKKEYWYDGQWKPSTIYIEEFKMKSGKVIKDTLIYTHHGPIVYNEQKETNFNKSTPAGHAMKWIAHNTVGSDLLTFLKLNKAKNYEDYREALAIYSAPAQNFVFASNSNDIAITVNGRLPLKWKNQGKFILDGSNPEHEWQGYIPFEQNPTVKNPPRGFVSSANQFSTDPTYPYYLGWKFAPAYRGQRINQRLDRMKNATADSLRMLQNDNYNLVAERLLPVLLPVIEKSKHKEAVEVLKEWDRNNEANSIATTIFETWSRTLSDWIWEDEFPDMYPNPDRTALLLTKEQNAKWFDNVLTADTVETFEYIVAGSFQATLDTLTKHHGEMKNWEWYKVKNTGINHLVPAFKSFSRSTIKNGGGAQIVNATTTRTGPSWRMVVELDKEWPRAYGLYPGGQSGRPSSKYYSNMIDDWAEGRLNRLIFMKSKDEKIDKHLKNIIINPKN